MSRNPDKGMCVHSVMSDSLKTHGPPLSMGFSRQKYWSGWPFPPLGDLTDAEMEPQSLISPVLADRFYRLFTSSATWGRPHKGMVNYKVTAASSREDFL